MGRGASRVVADRAPVGACLPRDLPELEDAQDADGRITSYNVCYTKLLRDKKSTGLGAIQLR